MTYYNVYFPSIKSTIKTMLLTFNMDVLASSSCSMLNRERWMLPCIRSCSIRSWLSSLLLFWWWWGDPLTGRGRLTWQSSKVLLTSSSIDTWIWKAQECSSNRAMTQSLLMVIYIESIAQNYRPLLLRLCSPVSFFGELTLRDDIDGEGGLGAFQKSQNWGYVFWKKRDKNPSNWG